MQRLRDVFFRGWTCRIARIKLLFRGFNFRGLPVNRENLIARKFPAIRLSHSPCMHGAYANIVVTDSHL